MIESYSAPFPSSYSWSSISNLRVIFYPSENRRGLATHHISMQEPEKPHAQSLGAGCGRRFRCD